MTGLDLLGMSLQTDPLSVPLQTVLARDASLAFIFFIAFSLMLVLGSRFALYAYWNLTAIEIESQQQLWKLLLFVGLAAGLYGLLGLIEAVTAVTQPTAITTPYRDGVLLGVLLLLSMTMKQIYESGRVAHTTEQQSDPGQQRTVEIGFALVITGSVFSTGFLGTHVWLTIIEGVGAVVVAGYGLIYGRKQLGRSSVQGTMIDSLLRHLLPVTTFGVLVLVVDLSLVAGLTIEVARHIQVVFVIMTATALMTSTIKLRQNVAGF